MGQEGASSAHMVQISIPASLEWTYDLCTVSNGPPTFLVVHAPSKGQVKNRQKGVKERGGIGRTLEAITLFSSE